MYLTVDSVRPLVLAGGMFMLPHLVMVVTCIHTFHRNFFHIFRDKKILYSTHGVAVAKLYPLESWRIRGGIPTQMVLRAG